MLWRGLRRRCAWCGGRGAFFTGWFRKQDTCKTCGIGWHRGYEGFELGAMSISAVVVFGSLVIGLLIGVIATTFFTLLIPLVQNAEQLIIVRLLTGIGAGGAVSAAFPIAAELMPAQHRRTYGAVYEMALAASFTVVPFIGGLLAGNADAFRFLALPGG